MLATNLEARCNPDGSADLRFSTDVEVEEISLAPDHAHLILAAGLATCPPDMVPRHDGFRVARVGKEGLALQFRFGPDNWLSIRLEPEDLHTLRSVLR